MEIFTIFLLLIMVWVFFLSDNRIFWNLLGNVALLVFVVYIVNLIGRVVG